MEHLQEMAWVSNHVPDDVTWPQKPRSWPRYVRSPISRKCLETRVTDTRVPMDHQQEIAHMGVIKVARLKL